MAGLEVAINAFEERFEFCNRFVITGVYACFGQRVARGNERLAPPFIIADDITCYGS